MDIIDICKKNALLYSEKVGRLNENPFPEYFDWSDHIATPETEDYLYHLNKTAIELDNLVTIFRPHIEANRFSAWEKNWYAQTISAAWIHDIGMLIKRDNHGVGSAELFFEENDLGFDFTEIDIENRIKIGMLCIRHNNGWPGVWGAMKKILQKIEHSIDSLEKAFADKNFPEWELDFSGRLLSVADFLRYRGKALKNDLKKPFFQWSKCRSCEIMYDEMRDFCSTTNCSGPSPHPEAVVGHFFDHSGFDPQSHPNFSVYQDPDSGTCDKIDYEIRNAHAFVGVRDENQIYTRGDMALSDVKLIDFGVWLDDLSSNGIDCRVFDAYTLDEADRYAGGYKTVVRVNFDVMNQDVAIFTLTEYIADHLHHNLATEDDMPHLIFSNKAILDIRTSDGVAFSQYLESMLDDQNLAPEVHEAVMRFEKIVHQWKNSGDIVLPMEIIERKLEAISL